MSHQLAQSDCHINGSFNPEEESLQSGHAPLASGIADVEISPQDVKLETVSSTISASTSTSSEDRVTEKLYRDDGTSSEDTQTTSHSRFYDVKVFLFLMCIFCITQGFALNGINNVNIPMYERRFKLTSTQTGLEASFYDIIAGCSVLLTGYFGVRTHQPRLIAVASLFLAFGSLTMALPHFMTGDYHPTNSRPPVCYLDGDNSTASAACSTEDRGLSSYLYMLLFGQALHGFAGTVLYSIAPSYLDGSVSSAQSPTYLGIFYGSSALGPAIGYVAGGQLLDVYVDSPKSPPEGLTKTSPGWVGAWWIGFLASFATCFTLAFPLFTYPRILPGTEDRRKNNISQAHDHGSQHKADQDGFGVTIRDMPAAFLLLLKNPAFVCQCLIGAGEGLMVSGLSTFLPKFIANQFNQTNSWAAMLTGFIAVPGAAAGQLLGGLIIRKFNMKVRDMIKFNMGCSTVVIIFVAIFWAKCDQGRIAGVTHNYYQPESPLDSTLDHSCNTNCGCDRSVYDPICMDGVEYFTACHAGCSGSINSTSSSSDFEVYSNCTCAQASLESPSHGGSNVTADLFNLTLTAKPGKCDSDCFLLYVFIPVTFIALLCTFMMSVPGTTIILRSVNDKQRTFALSIQQMCMRFIGTIPGPLLFGSILDNVCLVWQEKCDEKGSCWIYDSKRMGQYFYILTVAVKATTISLLIIAYKLYKPPPEPSESGITPVACSEDLPTSPAANVETTSSKL